MEVCRTGVGKHFTLLTEANWENDRENAIKTKTYYYFQGFGANIFQSDIKIPAPSLFQLWIKLRKPIAPLFRAQATRHAPTFKSPGY